jgi:hypothetical protein
MTIDKTKPSHTAIQLGVWRVLIAKSEALKTQLPWKDSFFVFRYLLVFITEIYTLAPSLVVFFILTKVWSGIQPSLILRTSNHLLTVVSN